MPRFEICFKVGDSGQSWKDGMPINWGRKGHHLTPAEYLAWFNGTGTDDHPDMTDVPLRQRRGMKLFVRRNRRYLSADSDTTLAQERYELRSDTPSEEQLTQMTERRAIASTQHAECLVKGLDSLWGFKTLMVHAVVLVEMTWTQLHDIIDDDIVPSESNVLRPLFAARKCNRFLYWDHLSAESLARVRDPEDHVRVRRFMGDGTTPRDGFPVEIAEVIPHTDERV